VNIGPRLWGAIRTRPKLMYQDDYDSNSNTVTAYELAGHALA